MNNIDNIIKYWDSLKPFSSISIPPLPRVDPELWQSYFIPRLIELGAIAKKDLIDKETYIGDCRNADTAVWNADKQVFTYRRRKFGYEFDEDINHFEDDNGYDLFVPLFIKA